MTRILCPLFSALLLAVPLLSGCDTDEPGPVATESGTGDIVIVCTPEEIAPAWSVSGPGESTFEGTGNSTITDIETGEYTITWGTMKGWDTPITERRTLVRESRITFGGEYKESVWVIVINPEPNTINAPWELSGPDEYFEAGSGDTTLRGLGLGSYILEWKDVLDWTKPDPDLITQSLAFGDTATFAGTYESIAPTTGTIIINPEPDSINAPWTLTGPNEYSHPGNGDETLSDLAEGSYTLEWSDVLNWTKPDPLASTLLLVSGDTVIHFGQYRPFGDFVPVSVGTFIMGSPLGELGRQSDETLHPVTLTSDFSMQRTEVTNGQFVDMVQWAYDQGHVTATSTSINDALDESTVELMNLEDPICQIDFSGGLFSTGYPNHPVLGATWYGSAAYCDWASLRAGYDRAYDHGTWVCNGGNVYAAEGYRLPTEAEWEYACRAGTGTSFSNGEITNIYCSDPVLDSVGWYCGNALGSTREIGTSSANTWGLYDMHGNLYEWCNDWYDPYPEAGVDPVVNPAGPAVGSDRVLRGGNFSSYAQNCRSANRYYYDPGNNYLYFGFRPVRSAE
ncbi:MAG: formylglycine-generating enzyme family protein [Gemmatimonadales bacterium]|nr:formylglycine-generating enzyme family protein [Gemmatimonadales bacterium]